MRSLRKKKSNNWIQTDANFFTPTRYAFCFWLRNIKPFNLVSKSGKSRLSFRLFYEHWISVNCVFRSQESRDKVSKLVQKKFPWIPHSNTKNLNFTRTVVLSKVLQQANTNCCRRFRKKKRNPQNVSGFSKSKFFTQNLLTFCGHGFEFEDSALNCEFLDSIITLCTCITIWL